MTNKEKLIELLVKCDKDNEVLECFNERPKKEQTAEIIADELLTNGIIVPPKTGIGDVSDGYHTFNELYHHRAVLFSVICNTFRSKAWKSRKHDDGTMFEDMFIVGIETPYGQATYHYHIHPYWDMFNVKQLDRAPAWDGHSPEEAIRRISMLQTENTITPPCKAGDIVYAITRNTETNIVSIHRGYVASINIRCTGKNIVICHEGLDDEPYFKNIYCRFEDFDESVFFTREEAEKALEKINEERRNYKNA